MSGVAPVQEWGKLWALLGCAHEVLLPKEAKQTQTRLDQWLPWIEDACDLSEVVLLALPGYALDEALRGMLSILALGIPFFVLPYRRKNYYSEKLRCRTVGAKDIYQFIQSQEDFAEGMQAPAWFKVPKVSLPAPLSDQRAQLITDWNNYTEKKSAFEQDCHAWLPFSNAGFSVLSMLFILGNLMLLTGHSDEENRDGPYYAWVFF